MLQIRLPRAAPNDTERLNEMYLRALTRGDELTVWGAYLLEEALEVVCLCRVVIALDRFPNPRIQNAFRCRLCQQEIPADGPEDY